MLGSFLGPSGGPGPGHDEYVLFDFFPRQCDPELPLLLPITAPLLLHLRHPPQPQRLRLRRATSSRRTRFPVPGSDLRRAPRQRRFPRPQIPRLLNRRLLRFALCFFGVLALPLSAVVVGFIVAVSLGSLLLLVVVVLVVRFVCEVAGGERESVSGRPGSNPVRAGVGFGLRLGGVIGGRLGGGGVGGEGAAETVVGVGVVLAAPFQEREEEVVQRLRLYRRRRHSEKKTFPQKTKTKTKTKPRLKLYPQERESRERKERNPRERERESGIGGG